MVAHDLGALYTRNAAANYANAHIVMYQEIFARLRREKELPKKRSTSLLFRRGSTRSLPDLHIIRLIR